MKNKFIKILYFGCVCFIILMPLNFLFADMGAEGMEITASPDDKVEQSVFFKPPLVDEYEYGSGQEQSSVEYSSVKDPRVLVGTILNSVLGIVGSITLVMIVIGGLMYLLARGNSDKITKARAIMIWAAIGLLVVIGSYFLVNTVFNLATTGTP